MKISKFAVIGHPISHTMSPFIHKRLFELGGYNVEYDVLDIENLKEKNELLKNYDGLNVTIPHKTNIIDLLCKIDDKAKRFGSVNTVKIENGKMEGFTTDGVGAIKAIVKSNGNINGDTVILGNGGASRAIAFEIEQYSKSLTIASRSLEKAEKLASEIKNCKFTTIEEISKTDCKYDLLINATSVGMYPNVQNSPVDENLIQRCETIFDAVYNPQDTMLIQKALKLNKNVVYGMDMLVYQAVVAHEIWYNTRFSDEDVLQLIKDAKIACREMFKGK